MWKKKIMTLLISMGTLLAVPATTYAAASDPSPEQVEPTIKKVTEVSQTSPKTGDFMVLHAGTAAMMLFGAGAAVVVWNRKREQKA